MYSSRYSEIASSVVQSFSQPFRQMRDKLIEKGIIRKYEEKFVLTTDYEFSSPSAAAAIVMGRNANGLTEWKLKNGTTLKDHESKD